MPAGFLPEPNARGAVVRSSTVSPRGSVGGQPVHAHPTQHPHIYTTDINFSGVPRPSVIFKPSKKSTSPRIQANVNLNTKKPFVFHQISK